MSSFLSEDTIEEIRIANDIVDVVSDYVKLEKKGKYYFGLCPFHAEKTPSFSVTPAMQIFNCFGCSKGGNVFHFIMNIENLDFPESVKFLADRARIALPESDEGNDAAGAMRNTIRQINKEAARFFHASLESDTARKAGAYLEKRGLKPGTVRKFGLGYSPDAGSELTAHLKKKGYSEDSMFGSGLVLRGRNGLYDRFKGRLMFPIFDIRNNVIGFGGRVLDNSNPKYMNSPETPVYNKRKSLYGLNFAKSSGERRVVVVEGYIDVISLHQSGIINSVASLGTALTEDQGRLLKKYFDEIIIAYDSDTAGMNAAMRGLDILDEIGCSVKVLQIPGEKDPDDYIRRNGAEAFIKLMNGALPLVEYKIHAYKRTKETETTEGKIKFINYMAEVLSRQDNQVKTEMYIKKLAGEYGISEEAIFTEIIKLKQPKKQLRKTAVKPDLRDAGKGKPEIGGTVFHDELMMLAAVCVDNRVYEAVREKIGLDDFDFEETRSAAEIAFDRISTGVGITPAEFMNLLEPETAASFSVILEKECIFDENRKPVDIVRKIKLNKLRNKAQEIFKKLGDRQNMNEGDVLRLTKELDQILKNTKAIQTFFRGVGKNNESE